MSSQPSFISIPKNPATSFAQGDSTNFKTIMSGSSLNGSRLDALIASSSDATNSYVLQLAIQKSAVNFVIGEVTIPAGAGTNGSTKTVSVLTASVVPGLSHTESGALFLESGATLVGRVKTVIAGSNSISLVGIGGDY